MGSSYVTYINYVEANNIDNYLEYLISLIFYHGGFN